MLDYDRSTKHLTQALPIPTICVRLAEVKFLPVTSGDSLNILTSSDLNADRNKSVFSSNTPEKHCSARFLQTSLPRSLSSTYAESGDHVARSRAAPALRPSHGRG
jgi:hypothetical protein